MQLRPTTLGLLAAAFVSTAFVTAPSAKADDIRLASGETISGVNVTEETLTKIFYRKGGSAKDVDVDQVISITYDEFPRLVKNAEDAAAEGDIASAIAAYDVYVDGQLDNPTEKTKLWAPAYSAFRSVELNRSLGAYDAVISAADRLLSNYGKTRYVPATYLAKAEALRYTGKADAAVTTLQSLAKLVADEKLSERYALDAELALLEIDKSLTPAKRLERLGTLVSRAGSKFPTVLRRAQLLQGQTQLELATAASEAKDAAKVDAALEAARSAFDTILAAPESDDYVRAGAHVGIGDCIFFKASPGDDAEGLAAAGREYLKVTVLYPGERVHLVHALFFAGRCYHQLGALNDSQVDRDRALRIFSRLRREFPAHPLSGRAREYMG
ncbi:MAG: hypothetical protein R3F34_11715 [Planctomycetota bacterium]